MKKVLLVDDEPEVLEVLKIRMKSWGYDTRTASNGLLAIDEVAREKPDLMILDVMMPDMDGFEVLEKIKAELTTKNIPVIMLSVAASASEIERGMNAGASFYMTKPYEAAELLKNIKKALGE